jgi:uncharacterized protein
MSKQHPFILKLGSFLPQSAGYKREFSFEQTEIALAEDFILHQLEGTVTATRTQQGLLLQGNFTGYVQLQCVRCLENYNHPLNWELLELYVFNRRDALKDDLILPDNAQVDISEFIREEALLDIPINPICKPDCQGLCQICGTNLNQNDCEHQDTQADAETEPENTSPFAGLKDMF